MSKSIPDWLDPLLADFSQIMVPFETQGDLALCVFSDERTGAWFCECHLKAKQLVEFSTTDVPLDPDDQSDYRANRAVVEDAYAFKIMKDDAKKGRTFSNIVAEYTKDFDESHPLKIIGGQHRFEAIREALSGGMDLHHGVKVYLGLNMEQRLDVQLISNTNIATSSDLFDRMQETYKGPELRVWCQTAGLLGGEQDFADRGGRGSGITVRMARTFITNYLTGKAINPTLFDTIETSPVICASGQHDPKWDAIRDNEPGLWTDVELRRAGREFSRLVTAQRAAFSGRQPKAPIDRPEKAMNAAVLAAWAYVAGILHNNEVRLVRHYSLADTAGRDPLNAGELARARHRTDLDNYRGLGFRTDPKERGRLVELFHLQADEGSGITKRAVELAIAKYHAKQAQLEVAKVQAKGE